ncbi:MAG: hypothetical protein QGF53_07565 [Alphaproteobacteria bacterium]|nr:hypothetical protein [Alphaproteobacteria bacterium]
MKTEVIEWVELANQVVLIADGSGKMLFHDLTTCRDYSPFATPMTGAGAPETTALLLNGAIAQGFGKGGCELQESAATLPKYVFNLVGAYHNSRRTPGHFRQAAARLREIGRDEIADYLERHAIEETGHDRLVIKDLRALGLPAESILEGLVPTGVRPLNAYFDGLAADDYPIGVIGYSYCFESTAALNEEAEVKALQALCPEGIDASRFLRTHSGLGSEVDHVVDMIDVIASLPADDRTRIVRATYETAKLIADCLRSEGDMTDADILAQLSAVAGEQIRLDA